MGEAGWLFVFVCFLRVGENIRSSTVQCLLAIQMEMGSLEFRGEVRAGDIIRESSVHRWYLKPGDQMRSVRV